MGVYELSGAGSLKTPRTVYSSMNGNNQFGAMVPIASAIGDGVNRVTFNNIPQTFQDLMLVAFARSVTGAAGDALDFLINNVSSGGLYTATYLRGDGSAAGSGAYSTNVGYPQCPMPGAGATSGVYASSVWHILNYANSTTFKTVLNRAAQDLNGSGRTDIAISLYRSTSSVTRFDFIADSGANFVAGSTFTLYGIRAVSS
jgi:hypothetical protein